MTDDTYNLNYKNLTNRKFINTFLPENNLSVEEKLFHEFNFTSESIIFKKLKWWVYLMIFLSQMVMLVLQKF